MGKMPGAACATVVALLACSSYAAADVTLEEATTQMLAEYGDDIGRLTEEFKGQGATQADIVIFAYSFYQMCGSNKKMMTRDEYIAYMVDTQKQYQKLSPSMSIHTPA